MQTEPPNQKAVPTGLALCIAGFALAGVVAWRVLPFPFSPRVARNVDSTSEARTVQLTLPIQAFEPLVPGVMAPKIEAEGWLNGPPPLEEGTSQSSHCLTVLDIWANWCPVCQVAPPALIKLYEKYHDRNVRFISLTDSSREAAEQLIARFSIKWPSGYGSPDWTINAYGALRHGALYGREINPIVYLIGPDGRILWTDENTRPKHQNFGTACGKLDQEIEAALGLLATESLP